MSAATVERAFEKLDAHSSRVSQLAGAAWPKLDPLPDPSEAAPEPFPLDGLGACLGPAARAVAVGVQCADALAAGSVLAAASLAVHQHADVEMPHGQRAPLALFVVTGAGSGDRKSAADQIVLREVDAFRKEQAREYMREKLATGDDKGSAQPVARSLTIGKATTEGLQMILRGQASVGLFTAEGGELLGGHSLREERRSAGLAWLLKAWGGETLDALTRGDGLSVLLGRRVALHAMVQPILLRQLLSDPLAQGQGLLARCLIAEPASLAGGRLFREGRPADASELTSFHARMRALLHRRPQTVGDGDGCELQPRVLPLAPAATALWIEFYNEVERQQAVGGGLERARPFASKAAEHAARIAGILELFDDPDAGAVAEDSMDCALSVAAFYLAEHVRLTGASTEARHLGLLQGLVAAIGSRMLHRDILQKAPRSIRSLKADGINRLLDELVQRGYIRRAGEAWEGRPND